MQEKQLSEILRSLVPSNQEQLSLLQQLLSVVQLNRRNVACSGPPSRFPDASGPLGDLQLTLKALPQELRKYLHGLAEAVEIYQSIKGAPLAVQSLTLIDERVYELRQIRDMCLEEGPRSIY